MSIHGHQLLEAGVRSSSWATTPTRPFHLHNSVKRTFSDLLWGRQHKMELLEIRQLTSRETFLYTKAQESKYRQF